jgi:hypothetical protein
VFLCFCVFVFSLTLKGVFIMSQIFNIRTVLLASLVTFSIASATAGSGHDLKPKFGGVVVETKTGDVEIVAKPDSIRIHVTDHGKAMKLDGAKAKVTLLNGTEKSEAELIAVGDKLEAKGAFKVAKGTKGIAVVTLAGKPPVTARFEIK